jgi:hypothetical protein
VLHRFTVETRSANRRINHCVLSWIVRPTRIEIILLETIIVCLSYHFVLFLLPFDGSATVHIWSPASGTLAPLLDPSVCISGNDVAVVSDSESGESSYIVACDTNFALEVRSGRVTPLINSASLCDSALAVAYDAELDIIQVACEEQGLIAISNRYRCIPGKKRSRYSECIDTLQARTIMIRIGAAICLLQVTVGMRENVRSAALVPIVIVRWSPPIA